MARRVNDPQHLGRMYRLPCPECDNVTRHKVVAGVDDSQVRDEMQYWEQFEIVMCLGCEEISFRKSWQSSEDLDYDDEAGGLAATDHPELFPPRRVGRKRLKRDYDLPPTIRAIYHEVHLAISNSQRILAGIGIRALVEAVCSEKHAQGKTLAARIDSLATMNVLTADAAKILHGTRLLGNEAAHEVAPPSELKLEAALDVAEQLLMNVFILHRIGEELMPQSTPVVRRGRRTKTATTKAKG